MRYRVTVLRNASKALHRLHPDAVRRISEAIDLLEFRPRPPGCLKIKSASDNRFRIRVGDYRILFTVDDKSHIVTVHRIVHRSEAYRSDN